MSPLIDLPASPSSEAHLPITLSPYLLTSIFWSTFPIILCFQFYITFPAAPHSLPYPTQPTAASSHLEDLSLCFVTADLLLLILI